MPSVENRYQVQGRMRDLEDENTKLRKQASEYDATALRLRALEVRRDPGAHPTEGGAAESREERTPKTAPNARALAGPKQL